MKKSLQHCLSVALFLAACFMPTRVAACFSDPSWSWGPTFQIVKAYNNDDLAFRSTSLNETVDFWYGYLRHSVDREIILTFFQSADIDNWEEDQKSNAFVQKLKADAFALKYLKACLQLQSGTSESWDYSANEAMRAAAAKSVAQMQTVPAAFKYRVALLKMRLYASQDDHDKIFKVWSLDGQNCPDAALKKRLDGYYASALYAEGRYKEAMAIYTAIGDERSMNMCISHYAGYEGIKQLAEEGDQSQMLYYAIQDYANHYCVSLYNQYEDDEYYQSEEYIEEAKDQRQEADRIKQLCRAHQNDKDKQVWLSLMAWMELTDKHNAEALDLALKVLREKVDDMQRDNAQRIVMLARLRMASSVANEKEAKQFADDFMALCNLSKQELNTPYTVNEDNYYSIYQDEEFCNHRPNFCFLMSTYSPVLVKYFKSQHLVHSQFCAQMLTEEVERMYYSTNPDYIEMMKANALGTNWFHTLNDEASPADISSLMTALETKKSTEAFAKNLLKNCEYDKQAFNDLMGTKLLRSGQYAEAIGYLQTLLSDYISGNAYQLYLAIRSYKSELPFKRCQYRDPYFDDEPTTNNRNYKLEFCQKMVDLKQKMQAANGEEKAKLEIEMAGRMYQASSHGDLWALSNYSWSAYKSEDDALCTQARSILHNALSDCTSKQTRLLVYYGLAAIPAGKEPFYALEYDWESEQFKYSFTKEYHPARQAYDYLKAHASESPLTSECDVIKWYAIHTK